MKILAKLAPLSLLIASPAIAQDASPAIDRLIDAAGLENLEGQEREAARTLVRRLLSNRSSSTTLLESAKNYMENEGYELVQLSTVYSDGEYYLVARTGLSAYATSDLPFGVNAVLFKDGEYFAKKNAISGGVSEFVDEDGDVQRLMFADWFSLR